MTTESVYERPSWIDDELFPFASHFLELDGNVVHYVDEGSGPTLLMLHGNPVWSFVYRDVIANLRDRFRCIALDFPGFGLSTGAPDFGYLAEDHAALLVSFVNRLELSGVTLVAHNWGGPFGIYAVEQLPDRFDRLIMSNTWAWPLNGDLTSELFARVMGGTVGGALITRFNLFVKYFIPSAHSHRTLSEAEMDHYHQATATRAQRRACAALPGQLIHARAFFTQLADGLADLRHLPTLILWAEHDPIFNHKYRERWETALLNHTTTVLAGTGHFLQSDAPAAFSDTIAAWCAATGP